MYTANRLTHVVVYTICMIVYIYINYTMIEILLLNNISYSRLFIQYKPREYGVRHLFQ